MVTENILLALRLLEDSASKEEKAGIQKAINMLENYDDDLFVDMSGEEKEAWVKNYL
ncbi:hypothetical protein M2146_001185 [Lachnospiraceae bacterium PF1-22]